MIYYPNFGLAYQGLLLPAGEYVFQTRATAGIPGYLPAWNPAEHSAQALLVGQWVSTAHQAKLWYAPSYSNTYVTVPTTTGRAVKGFKFTIAAGVNGVLPAVQFNFLVAGTSYGPILKRVNATQYSYFGSSYGYGQGLILQPGDYVAEFTPEELTADHYRFAKILGGWLVPGA